MPKLLSQFGLERCPHCKAHNPVLIELFQMANSGDYAGRNQRTWAYYRCATCGSFVSACAPQGGVEATDWFPRSDDVHSDVPGAVARFLQQALDTLNAPDGSIVMSASAIDAMLRIHGYTEGTLFSRIDKAAADHLITQDMAEWAHDVRLDANDIRHVNEASSIPTLDDARRAFDFAQTIAELLFVLPARVRRGRKPVDQS